MKRLFRFIPTGSIVLGATTFASYGFGLIRDHMFANTFGASRTLDAYNAAFLVPDLLFNVLIASGIAAAFVPIFIQLFYSNKQQAYQYTNSVMSAATGTMILSALVLIIFAGPLSGLVAPGFNHGDRLLVAQILRVLAISPILFGISNTLGAMLIAKRRFLFYGLSPVMYNLGIILGIVLLAPRFGIMGVAYGTVFGALLHMLFRVVDALVSGFRFKPSFNFKSDQFRKTVKLMIPKMFGHPVELAMFWGFTALASTLSTGSVAVLNFSRNFQSVPVSLIGITFATTVFPIMSNAVASGSPKEFRKVFINSFLLILAGSIAAAIAMFLLRHFLIKMVLGGGAFNEQAVRVTALTLAVFTLAIPTESLIQLLARAFYATKNTVIPVIMSLLSLLIGIGGAYLLVPRFGIVSIPLAFFAATLVELTMLMIILPSRIKRLPWLSVINNETNSIL